MSFFASTVAGDVEEQLEQVAGALCVLAGFAAAQLGLLSTRSPRYLMLNLVGSLVLAALAALDRQLGFLLLEGAWALVSASSLAAVLLETAKTPSKRGPRQSPVTGDPGLESGTSSLSAFARPGTWGRARAWWTQSSC
jgi:hypothetical protein